MNRIFNQNLKKRKEYLSVIAKSKTLWKIRMTFMIILFIVAILILVGVGYALAQAGSVVTSSTVLGFGLGAIGLACAPFFLGIYMRNSARYYCAAPYSGMTNGTLILDDNKMKYIFWKASIEAPAAYSSKRALYRDEDKFTYCFEKSNIKSMKIDEYHICHITGNGTLTVPMWESSNDTIETIRAKELSFLISFEQDDAETTIKDWRNA